MAPSESEAGSARSGVGDGSESGALDSSGRARRERRLPAKLRDAVTLDDDAGASSDGELESARMAVSRSRSTTRSRVGTLRSARSVERRATRDDDGDHAAGAGTSAADESLQSQVRQCCRCASGAGQSAHAIRTQAASAASTTARSATRSTGQEGGGVDEASAVDDAASVAVSEMFVRALRRSRRISQQSPPAKRRRKKAAVDDSESSGASMRRRRGTGASEVSECLLAGSRCAARSTAGAARAAGFPFSNLRAREAGVATCSRSERRRAKRGLPAKRACPRSGLSISPARVD